MEHYYTSGRTVQILLAVLKANGIKKVIVSPGTTNIELVGSMQYDTFFEMYSCLDERSAAYMACGLAAESGEPVILTCTEATASRNYFPGLTEAFHRKLPILAITCMHGYSAIGHLEPQVINRDYAPSDSIRAKFNLNALRNGEDEWDTTIKINQAILELTRNGGGPVHINLPWLDKDFEFSEKQLPPARVIRRFTYGDTLPDMLKGKIGVFVGGHNEWSSSCIKALESFCEAKNSVVICDHTSKYYGKYRIMTELMAMQAKKYHALSDYDLIIHIGEESGDLYTISKLKKSAKEVWRVSPDGELRDTFRKLSNVFQMTEEFFFEFYSKTKNTYNDNIYQKYKEDSNRINDTIPELPFSNIYAAYITARQFPLNSVVHLGMSDTLRAWTMFEFPTGVRTSANAGCRGIDGSVSSLIGASFSNPDKFYYGIVGDLTFFYDMNSLGNRNIRNNVRLLMVNNNGGNIFRHRGAPAERRLGSEDTSKYVAAAGHYGNKSRVFVKHYAEDLGFEYLSACNKEEFDQAIKRFLTPQQADKPMLFEMFTEESVEIDAFEIMRSLETDASSQAKSVIKHMLGPSGTAKLKSIFGK